MLEIKDLNVFYGAIHALKGISLTVDEGELVSLIGANGAGKTTTLHTISGLLTAASGSITLYIEIDTRRGVLWPNRFLGEKTRAGQNC